MIVRGEHYCTNHQFVKNFKRLFAINSIELLQNELVYHNKIITEIEADAIMKTFVNMISSIDVENLESIAPFQNL